MVLVHGNPVWGYVWRAFVQPLLDAGYRVVVPDYLGFGRSDKPADADLYTPRRHAERFDALMESLDLHDVTVVPQDWGGPIGLWWAGRHPERIRGLFILNTFINRPLIPVELPVPLRLFRKPLVGEVMVKGLDVFKRGLLFKSAVKHPERMTELTKRAYLQPHPDWSSRTAVLVFPRHIPSGPDGDTADLMGEVEEAMDRHFRDKPMRVVWSMGKGVFGEAPLRHGILPAFADVDLVELDDAGHFAQEDVPEKLVASLLDFLENGRPPGHRTGPGPLDAAAAG